MKRSIENLRKQLKAKDPWLSVSVVYLSEIGRVVVFFLLFFSEIERAGKIDFFRSDVGCLERNMNFNDLFRCH